MVSAASARCILLLILSFFCIFYRRTANGQNGSSASIHATTDSVISISTLLPTATLHSSSLQPTPAPSPKLPETDAATTTEPVPASLKQYVIILGVTTGVFFVLTVLCSTILIVICCRKLKSRMVQKETPTDGVFDGAPVSAHWLSSPTDHDTKSDSLGITGLPIWSAATFQAPTEPEVNMPTITVNGVPCENPKPPEAYEVPKHARFKPKRTAPPPPKVSKKQKRKDKAAESMDASVVYDVPVSSRWYSKKRRPSKTKYKELNLKQVQSPSQYQKPQGT